MNHNLKGLSSNNYLHFHSSIPQYPDCCTLTTLPGQLLTVCCLLECNICRTCKLLNSQSHNGDVVWLMCLWEVQGRWVSGSSKDKSKQPAKISLIVPIATIIDPTLQEGEKGKMQQLEYGSKYLSQDDPFHSECEKRAKGE